VRKAEFIPAAREEFLAEVAFYQAIQPLLGEKFSLAVQNALALALAFPMAGSSGASGTRRVVIKGFPFWLVYKVSLNDDIVIFAVAHQSRQPGYWRNRIS
jgi:plasmid stabilization system protein ParE